MAFNKARLKKIIKEAVQKQLKEEEVKGDPARVAMALEKSPLLDRMLDTINTKSEVYPVLSMLIGKVADNKGIDANMLFIELEKIQKELRGGAPDAQEEPAAPANRSDASLDEDYRKEQKAANMQKDLQTIIDDPKVTDPKIKEKAAEYLKRAKGPYLPNQRHVNKLIQAAYPEVEDPHLPSQYRNM